MSLLDPRGHPIRAIVYHGEHPSSAIVDDGGNEYYDFEWCERDRQLYWHASAHGPKTPTIELGHCQAFPDIWIRPGEIVEVSVRSIHQAQEAWDVELAALERLDAAGLKRRGYQLITEQPANPFDDTWEDKCYWCDACEDALPYDRPCEHLCYECNEPAPQLLAGLCGDCCAVVLDGETIWQGEHAGMVVRFDCWGEPWREEAEDG